MAGPYGAGHGTIAVLLREGGAMRPTAITALSVAAVLGAGALAAAANLRVLAGPDNALSGGSTEPEAALMSRTPPSVATSEPQLFQIGPAGAVTLDTTGGLHAAAVAPAPGWRATTRAGPAGAVVTRFTAPSGETLTATGTLGAAGIRVAITGTGTDPGHLYNVTGPNAEDD